MVVFTSRERRPDSAVSSSSQTKKTFPSLFISHLASNNGTPFPPAHWRHKTLLTSTCFVLFIPFTPFSIFLFSVSFYFHFFIGVFLFSLSLFFSILLCFPLLTLLFFFLFRPHLYFSYAHIWTFHTLFFIPLPFSYT